jgi:murein DD-endopeptidase MepM/ murein hydrolase activator NlpD
MIPDVTSITSLGGKANPKEVAAKVQGMFTEVMLKAMEDSVDAEDGLFSNSATSDIYRGMLREQLGGAISKQMQSPLETQLGEALTSLEASPYRARASRQAQPGQTSQPAQPVQPAAPSHEDSGLPVSGIISSPEGWRHDPINGETRYHAGTDIAAPLGTPIHAVAEGRVIESGRKNGYGNTVVVQTDDGRKMLYAHNNQNFVRVGDWVSRGDTIAEVGSTGRATGPHVHFEVKF